MCHNSLIEQCTSMSQEEARLTPKQTSTLNQILRLGGDRGSSKEGLAAELKLYIANLTENKLVKFPEKSVYFTKSDYMAIQRCETQYIVNKENYVKSSTPQIPTIVGQLSHKAVQMSYTHPNKSADHYVRNSILGLRASDANFDEFMSTCGEYIQSDIIAQTISKVTNFMDDWPRLDPSWGTRFEEPLSCKIGKLTLSGRADFIIGRPRTDSKRTLLIVDLKTGNVKDEHREEALFYALVATLRYEIMPWRSIIYSLASGEYTQLDFTEEDLFEAATKVSLSVNNYVEIMSEQRDKNYSYGDHCNYCPIKLTCLEYKKNSAH